ncbi:transmembrane protein, putative (macronuclear) [Tetrahymena thermophila SB210]|uniref:Transmembrane protein, putative n=1 Tax=Tetrahymena thermophila (strain SB210) TaxID=312017 RepID=W7X3T4_TETTS|nr:transmembrane protein, putative [Tetrahymena thermophila SB210]EWS71083.1 transmembrane protein, putative [Tetrahymena thermophila SB210]|eukprot:XP_012656382.1 transmembrane protein, putative [Tetrahymena thermophila SB210]
MWKYWIYFNYNLFLKQQIIHLFLFIKIHLIFNLQFIYLNYSDLNQNFNYFNHMCLRIKASIKTFNFKILFMLFIKFMSHFDCLSASDTDQHLKINYFSFKHSATNTNFKYFKVINHTQFYFQYFNPLFSFNVPRLLYLVSFTKLHYNYYKQDFDRFNFNSRVFIDFSCQFSYQTIDQELFIQNFKYFFVNQINFIRVPNMDFD